MNKKVKEQKVETEDDGVVEAQVAELVGDLQRTRADFENFRK